MSTVLNAQEQYTRLNMFLLAILMFIKITCLIIKY